MQDMRVKRTDGKRTVKVELPEALHRRLRLEAINRGTTLASLVIELASLGLADRKKGGN